jgi:hypothetical protein
VAVPRLIQFNPNDHQHTLAADAVEYADCFHCFLGMNYTGSPTLCEGSRIQGILIHRYLDSGEVRVSSSRTNSAKSDAPTSDTAQNSNPPRDHRMML